MKGFDINIFDDDERYIINSIFTNELIYKMNKEKFIKSLELSKSDDDFIGNITERLLRKINDMQLEEWEYLKRCIPLKTYYEDEEDIMGEE